MIGSQTGRAAKDFETRFLAVYEGSEDVPLSVLRTRLTALGAVVADGVAVRKGVRMPRLEVALPQAAGVFRIPADWPDPAVRLLEFTFPAPDCYNPRAVVRRPTSEVVGPFGTRPRADKTRTLIVLGEPRTIVLLRNLHTGTGHFVNVTGTPSRLMTATQFIAVTGTWPLQLQKQRGRRQQLVPWMDRVHHQKGARGH